MRLYFGKHIDEMDVHVGPGSTLCLYHKSYPLPKILNCTFMPINQYKDIHANNTFLKKYQNVVFVGTNRMINSSNRIDPIWEILFNSTKGIRCYSVDNSPYIGPLWRLWFQFGITNLPFGGYTYSYLIQSHYDAFLEGVRTDNPLSLDKIKNYAKGNVFIDYDSFFSKPNITIIPMMGYVHDEYQQLKKELFDQHDTIVPIIRGLANFAKSVCKERKIPQEYKIFETPDRIDIVRTDLKVDEYLTQKILDKIIEVESVVEVMQ